MTHGATRGGRRASEYPVWASMIGRCCNPNAHAYLDYGGRGISVHPTLRTYEGFIAVLGQRPSKDHQLDRYPDNNGDYAPGNVRWATRKEQARNRRSTRMLTAFGATRTFAEWVEISGVKHQTISDRLRRGLSPEDALSIPVIWGGESRHHFGESYGTRIRS